MLFHIHCVDKPDSEHIRLENRPNHLKHLDKYAPHIWAAGPTLTDDGKGMSGSVLIVEFDTLVEAQNFRGRPLCKSKAIQICVYPPLETSFPQKLMPLYLCDITDIPNGTAIGRDVGEGVRRKSLILFRQDSNIYCYLNSCPHIGVPLDWEPDKFMDAEQKHLQCATHGALFIPETGLCVLGPCTGQKLEACPTSIVDEKVYMTDTKNPR